MGGIIETGRGRTLLSEVSHYGDYMCGNYVLNGFGNELQAVITGNTVNILSGGFSCDGKRVLIDNLSISIPYTSTGTRVYVIYAVLRMDDPENITAVYAQEGSTPTGYVNQNLMNYGDNGVKFLPLWKVTASTNNLNKLVRVLDLYDTGWVDIREILNTANFTSTDLAARRIGKLVEIKGVLDASKAHTTTTAGVQWTKSPSVLATQFLPSKAEKVINVGNSFNQAWVELSTDGTGTIVRTTTNLASGNDIYINLRYTTD